MKPATAAALSRALDELSVEHSTTDSYSGRGMYGAQTSAVVCDVNTLVAAAAIAARDMAFVVADADADNDHAATDLRDFIEDLRTLRVDDMGRSQVVY